MGLPRLKESSPASDVGQSIFEGLPGKAGRDAADLWWDAFVASHWRGELARRQRDIEQRDPGTSPLELGTAIHEDICHRLENERVLAARLTEQNPGNDFLVVVSHGYVPDSEPIFHRGFDTGWRWFYVRDNADEQDKNYWGSHVFKITRRKPGVIKFLKSLWASIWNWKITIKWEKTCTGR